MMTRIKQAFLTGSLGLLACVSFMQAARAQDVDEKQYIFGTRVALISQTQYGGPPAYSWWGDMLPMPYTHATGWIVQEVNADRLSRGDERQVDYKSYPIVIGGEMQTDAGWEYYLDFQGMNPVDVDFILSTFPLEGVFADLPMEIRPVSSRSYYANSQEGASVTLELPGGALSFDPGNSFDSARGAIAAQLEGYFGMEVAFDFSMNRYYSAADYNNFDVSITIYMDDSWQSGGYPMDYGD